MSSELFKTIEKLKQKDKLIKKLEEGEEIETINLFTPEEQTILEEINKNAFEYLSGIMKMTTQQEGILKKYITLKLLVEY